MSPRNLAFLILLMGARAWLFAYYAKGNF